MKKNMRPDKLNVSMQTFNPIRQIVSLLPTMMSSSEVQLLDPVGSCWLTLPALGIKRRIYLLKWRQHSWANPRGQAS